ncbi:MAG: response regulator, partial [Candidatus Omnitrophica bacterium]|nr:response regulator [Candidatus Omnitrophota bacterium]
MDKENILIIDDDKLVCTALKKELEGVGYTADYAMDAEEALSKVSEKKYDIIFVDFVLPRTDGIEVCRKIKEIRPDSIVVFITGKVDKNTIQDEVRFMEEGGESKCLYKPFFENEIAETV